MGYPTRGHYCDHRESERGQNKQVTDTVEKTDEVRKEDIVLWGARTINPIVPTNEMNKTKYIDDQESKRVLQQP